MHEWKKCFDNSTIYSTFIVLRWCIMQIFADRFIVWKGHSYAREKARIALFPPARARMIAFSFEASLTGRAKLSCQKCFFRLQNYSVVVMPLNVWVFITFFRLLYFHANLADNRFVSKSFIKIWQHYPRWQVARQSWRDMQVACNEYYVPCQVWKNLCFHLFVCRWRATCHATRDKPLWCENFFKISSFAEVRNSDSSSEGASIFM